MMLVSPAPAGMIPTTIPKYVTAISEPRTRGDDPGIFSALLSPVA